MEEKIILSGHPSWWPYVPGIGLGIILLSSGAYVKNCADLPGSLRLIAWYLLLLLSLYRIGKAVWNRFAMRYILTESRLIVVTGVIIKNETSVWLSDISLLKLSRNLWHVLTGCGSVIAGTNATSGVEIVIRNIRHPKELQAQINAVVNK